MFATMSIRAAKGFAQDMRKESYESMGGRMYSGETEQTDKVLYGDGCESMAIKHLCNQY
jgi:hypothetical protein